jgi:nucleolar complex protein 2
MGKKATKATKKFASSGQLKQTIQARHRHQQIRKRVQNKKGTAKQATHEKRGEEEEAPKRGGQR